MREREAGVGPPGGRVAGPALVMEAALVFMVVTGLERVQLVPITVGYSLAFAAMLWSFWRHREALNDAKTILVWAVVFRLTLLPFVPDLSDDYFRYIWDGWLMSEGINPYAFKPSDPALAVFNADPLFGQLNSPHYHSVYPPVSQVVFLAGGWLYPHLGWVGAFILMKAVFVAAELGGLWLMVAALKKAGKPLAPLVLYAWNPLIVVVFAGQGHSEAALVLGFGLALYGLYAGRAKLSWLGVLVAGMTKLVPFAAAPLWLRYWGLRGSWPALAVGLALTGLFCIPDLAGKVGSSLNLYVEYFEFNAGLYTALKWGIWWVTEEDMSKSIGPALRVAFLGWTVAILAIHPVRKPDDVLGATALILAGYLFAATTVHPWYLSWLLVLVPFVGPLRWSWVWASYAAFLTYFAYLGWNHLVQTALVWVGFLIFAGVDLFPVWIDGVLRRRGRTKAQQIEPHLVGSRVLDLGCGEGYVAQGLRRDGRDVVLADVESFNKTGLFHVRYDGRRLPFGDDSFDTVVLSLVLHHAEDQGRVLEEARRVARRRVVVTESTFETPFQHRLLDFLDRRANRLRGEGEMRQMEAHLHFRSVPEWESVFEAVGFEVKETRWLGRFIHMHVLFELDVV